MKNTVSINQNTLFRRLYYRGKVQHSSILVLHYMPNGLKVNRLGITVSKKVGNAVKRNRIRRHIYEAYRLYESQLKTGYDFVFVAKCSAVGADFSHYLGDMKKFFSKSGLLL